jgi:Zn-dependent peptidase ImmA (M78 family)
MNKYDFTAEKQANDFRQKNGFNLTEAIRIKSILQKNNILTVFLPLASDFSGMAVKIGESEKTKRFLLVNSSHTLGRQHFTICHELYHLYYQSNFTSSKNNVGAFNKNGDPEEYKADLFASFLLLPTAGISQIIPEPEFSKNKITLKTILAIEHYYSCSRSALLNRLKHMGLIDNELMESFSINKIKNAVLYGYNKDLYLPGNSGVVIGDYGTIARDLFEKGIVSESAYFSLLEDLGFDLSELDNKTDNE